MPERIPLEQRSEPNPQRSQEDRRHVEAPFAEGSELHVEWSELQKQLDKVHQELLGLLSTPPTEESKDRVPELQEQLEEIHDRQHEIVGRQASAEQVAIRQWSTNDQNLLGANADSIARNSK